MKNRLNRIITKTGDKGFTGLSDGKRTSKNDPIIHVLGELDELNCSIGLLKSKLIEKSEKEKTYIKFTDILIEIQHDLFNIGGEISAPNIKLFDRKRINLISELFLPVKPQITNFVSLPIAFKWLTTSIAISTPFL